MLSQEYPRQLDMIARHLEESDPRFARGLREGIPTAPSGDRRWPIVTAWMIAMAVLLLGLAAASAVLIVLSLPVAVGAIGWYRRHTRRVQRVPARSAESKP